MPTPETIKLRGGALCLDFANSSDWTEAGEPVEAEDALVEPDSLLRWGVRLGVIARLDTGAAAAAAAEHAAARELRPAVRTVLIAAAHGETPDPGASDLLLRTHADATAAAHLTLRPDGAYALDWPDDDPRKVRFAVATDAITLLTDPTRLTRIRVCPGLDCGWLFLNKSGRQRWCTMDTCGSRSKMRTLYARRQAARHTAPENDETAP